MCRPQLVLCACLCLCLYLYACVCVWVSVRFMLSAYPLPLPMLPAAAQLNLSQRWVLMSFSSVGVARLARLDVFLRPLFTLPAKRAVSDGLKGFVRSILPVRFRYQFNVCRYCACSVIIAKADRLSRSLMDFSLRQSAKIRLMLCPLRGD